ncbi:MAG TPA: sugar nucleotide-binding protein [Kribbella sp.]|nr:sugar nucleotide-binding protein [Kribbella sp.]
MTILITGGTGRLGGELIGQAVGREVVATYHHRAPAEAAGVDWRWLDIRRQTDVNALIEELRPAAVIHTAYVQSDWTSTADGAVYVAAAAAVVGARLVHVSSDLVFSGRNSPYDEDAVPDPITPYGAAKAAAETAIKVIHPSAVIARTSLIIGRSTFPQEVLVHALAEGTRQGGLFTDNIRCPVHVSDLAAALLELMESGHVGVAHLGGAEALSRYHLGLLIAKRDGLDPARLARGSCPSDIRLDSTRTQRLLKTRLRGATEALLGPR